MAPGGIVLALSNPDPEIPPDVAAKYAAVVEPAAVTSRTKSTTCSRSQGFSAAHWMPGRARSPKGCEDRRGRSDVLRRQRRPRARPYCPEPVGPTRRGSGCQSGGSRGRHRRVRRLAALLLAALLTTTLMAGCASETGRRDNAAPEVVVGSAPDAGSALLAALYLAALHAYGFGARAAYRRRPDGEAGLGRIHRPSPPSPGGRPPGVAARRVGCLPMPRCTARWSRRCPRASPRATTPSPPKISPCWW